MTKKKTIISSTLLRLTEIFEDDRELLDNNDENTNGIRPSCVDYIVDDLTSFLTSVSKNENLVKSTRNLTPIEAEKLNDDLKKFRNKALECLNHFNKFVVSFSEMQKQLEPINEQYDIIAE